MSFEYGIHKEVVEAFVHEAFNNGMGIYGNHYNIMIDFIYDKSDYEDSDLFNFNDEFIELKDTIENDFVEYYLSEEKGYEIIADWLFDCYCDAGYTINDMLNIVDWVEDKDKNEIKKFLEERMFFVCG